ncbi:hypothetical protein ACFLWS_02160 [Chloroflexota bacterium]
MDKRITERQAMVIIEITISAVLFIFSLWATFYEFGWAVLNKPIVWIVIFYMGILGYVLFRMRWTEAGKKSEMETLSTNIDELIKEIREDRNERNSSK